LEKESYLAICFFHNFISFDFNILIKHDIIIEKFYNSFFVFTAYADEVFQ